MLGEFVFVGAGAIILGRARIEEGAYIAPGAVIRDSCRIGRYAVVGLGSVVTKDVPDFAIVIGNPARAIGKTDDRVEDS